MNNNRFDDAFSPVPELVHERFQKALREKNQMKISKTKRSAAVLAVALAIVLALAGVAYAATKLGILDYLVGGEDKASDNLKQSVQPIAVSATGDGIRVNLTGAVYDGDRLSLSFDMESLTPKELAMVTLDTVTLNGDQVNLNFSSANEQWLPSVFNIDEETISRNPVYGGMLSDQLEKKYSGSIQGEATFIVTRPTNGKIVILDPMMWYDYPAAIEDAGTRKDYENRKQAIQGTQVEIAGIFDLGECLDIQRWFDSGYTMLNADGGFLLDSSLYQQYRDDNFGDVAASHMIIQRNGQMKETAKITIPFTIDADKALETRREFTPDPVELSDYTVHFDAVVLTPLSTIIRMNFIPNDSETAEAFAPSFALCELTDEKGELLKFSDMEGESNGYNEDEDGKSVYVIEYHYGGLNEMPKEIHFVPYAPDDPDEIPEGMAKARKEFSDKVFIKVE